MNRPSKVFVAFSDSISVIRDCQEHRALTRFVPTAESLDTTRQFHNVRSSSSRVENATHGDTVLPVMTVIGEEPVVITVSRM
jgi:hypothetical protein